MTHTHSIDKKWSLRPKVAKPRQKKMNFVCGGGGGRGAAGWSVVLGHGDFLNFEALCPKLVFVVALTVYSAKENQFLGQIVAWLHRMDHKTSVT